MSDDEADLFAWLERASTRDPITLQDMLSDEQREALAKFARIWDE